MKRKKLDKILDKHDKWLKCQEGGQRADLRYVDLTNTDLSGVNLSSAVLLGTNLSHAALRNTNLSGSHLADTNLLGADLRDADLSFANMRNANLISADMRGTNMHGANLSGANLLGADMRNAKLAQTDYTNTILNLQCPEKGSFIAYKKLNGGLVAELLIPEDAERSSATTRKCRASKAIVLAIYDKNGEKVSEGRSQIDESFVYRVGETVYPDYWDKDRWNECSGGIHFFITRKEAEEYV